MLPTGKKIPDCLSGRPIFFDPSSDVGDAFGGREWFWETSAAFVHRVGLMDGLGWEYPTSDKGLNYVRVYQGKNPRGFYDMVFGIRIREANELVIAEVVRREGVPKASLRDVFLEVTVSG